MPYIDGLPLATEVATTDVLPIAQGVTGIPGEAVTRGINVQLLLNAAFAENFATYFLSLPTTLPSTAGVVWNNGGALSIS